MPETESYSDDFERTGADLGADWQVMLHGSGNLPDADFALSKPTDICTLSVWVSDAMLGEPDGALQIYGRMNCDLSNSARVGARIRYDSPCTGCGKPPAAGDAMIIDCAPAMSGTWHHTDCSDPKLERVKP